MGGLADAAGLMFGGSSIDAPQTSMANINAGGIRVNTNPETGMTTATSNSARNALVDRIGSTYQQEASGLRALQPRIAAAYNQAISSTDDLLGRVRPGFGELTDAAVTAIDRGRQRATSNLRGELNKRRILGSSFANNQIASTELDFTEQEKAARAESFLQELDLTTQLTEQRLQQTTASIDADLQLMSSALAADRASEELDLNEMNNLFNAANGLASLNAQIAQQNAQLQYDANVQTANAKMEGLGFVSSLAFSDIRLKENIIHIGEENGYPLYLFNYRGSDQKHIGVMAQDVMKVQPEAVVETPSGYLAVNYDLIGVEFKTVN